MTRSERLARVLSSKLELGYEGATLRTLLLSCGHVTVEFTPEPQAPTVFMCPFCSNPKGFEKFLGKGALKELRQRKLP